MSAASWRTVALADLHLTPAEQSALEGVQDSASIGAAVLANVVGEFRDAIELGGTTLGTAGTVPDLVRLHVINRARWLWLCEFPDFAFLQTEVRKALNKSAEEMLEALRSGKTAAPSATTGGVGVAGTWNSENKLAGRMHPVPPPASIAGDYANPDAPADTAT